MASLSPNAKTAADPQAKKPKKKPPPTPEELESMIQSKIHQLESERTSLEEEEDAMDKAIKNATTEINKLAESTHGDTAALQAKYIGLFETYKVLERDYAKLKKKYELANKERDSAKSDLAKANAQKQKVETVCRELQKENRKIKDESQRLAQSEQQKREELSSKFESTIWEIKSKMEEESDDRSQTLDEAEVGRTRDRLRSFLQQYELREKHFNSLMRSKEVEYQLLEARCEQQRQLMEQEALKVSSLRGQLTSFAKSEADLRSQLATYISKFKTVEETLTRSNEIFLSFKSEIEATSKRTKRFEQLCRALQQERNDLRTRLAKYEKVDMADPIDVD